MTMSQPVPMRRMLSLRFFAIALAFMLCMLGVSGFWLLPRLQDLVVRSNELLATTLAIQVEKYLATSQRALTVAEDRLTAPGRRESITPLLDALVDSNDVFEAMYVLDPAGRITHLGLPYGTTNRDTFLNLDLSRGVLFSEARRKSKRDRYVWSSVFLSLVTGRLAVAVALPVADRLLIGEVGLANLSDYVRRVAGQENVAMMIVDSRGQILAHPDVNLASQQLNISDMALLRKGAGSSGLLTEITRFQGVDMVGTRAPIAGIDWSVLIMQPVLVARQPVMTTMLVLAGVGLVVLALSIGLGWFFSRSLSELFGTLVDMAEAVAVGRYPTEWQPSRIDEFSRLIDSLRRMSGAVKERESALARSQDDLKELNQSLEQRVAERTAQIESANAELRATLDQLSTTQANLERADRLAALGSLVAGIAHELNTPIGNSLVVATTCTSHQEQFEKSIEQGLTRGALTKLLQENKTALEMIRINLQRAAELITSFKQVAVDQTTSKRRQFELCHTLHEIVLTVTPSIQRSGCRVVTDLPEQDIPMDGYPGPLAQVVTNLINNAVIHGYNGQASPGGGEIVLRVRQVDECVELSVSDNGAGIPADIINRIFDPFFTTRMGRGGTGLGLSVVHNIVRDLLGGSIRAESRDGSGARFVVVIPCVSPESVAGED